MAPSDLDAPDPSPPTVASSPPRPALTPVTADLADDLVSELGDFRPTKATDGRHARSERSRQAMVDALLDLLRDGNMRPSSAQIAERAGVTQRTLFNQFGDMESLVQAVAARQARRILGMLPRAEGATLEERVASYCAGLQGLLEETMHVRWAVVSNPHADWTGAAAVGAAREFMRGHLAEAFAPELVALDDDGHAEVLDALELETDPAAWRLRRVLQGLEADQARRAVQRTMLAVLRDASS